LEQCRKDYDTMELKGSSRLVRKSTKTIIDSGLQKYTKGKGRINGLNGPAIRII
jgi:hypothetical protein